MIFSKETWELVGKGYNIYDCAFREEMLQVFVFVEMTEGRDPIPDTRIVFSYNDEEEPEERYFYQSYNDFEFARVACRPTKNEVCVIDMNRNVYGYDSDQADREDLHPYEIKGSELVSVPMQIERIGDNLYTVGNPRRMHKRIGVNQWKDMTADLPIPPDFLAEDGEAMVAHCWKDLSGFSEQDIYTGGGEGEVFRFDGKTWKQCDFPSNELIHNVCCGDKSVYIGGNMGRLWVGREDQWKLVSEHEFTMPWKDIVWFKGRVFMGSDYGLWELKEDKIIRAEIPDQAQLCSGSLDVSADGNHLLTAGQNGASLFDGDKWEVLFDRAELEGFSH